MAEFSKEYRPNEFAGIVDVFMKALLFKDRYTKAHSERVGLYSAQIARKMNLTDHDIHVAYTLGVLHDIGKLFVPDHILMKPGALTDDEWIAMRKHATDAVRILACMSVFDHYLDIIRAFHERFDGLGYPDGLQGEQIPLIARIVSVADSYDAMVTTRPYRKAQPKESACGELERERGRQFCPQVVDSMLELIVKKSNGSNGNGSSKHGRHLL